MLEQSQHRTYIYIKTTKLLAQYMHDENNCVACIRYTAEEAVSPCHLCTYIFVMPHPPPYWGNKVVIFSGWRSELVLEIKANWDLISWFHGVCKSASKCMTPVLDWECTSFRKTCFNRILIIELNFHSTESPGRPEQHKISLVWPTLMQFARLKLYQHT